MVLLTRSSSSPIYKYNNNDNNEAGELTALLSSQQSRSANAHIEDAGFFGVVITVSLIIFCLILDNAYISNLTIPINSIRSSSILRYSNNGKMMKSDAGSTLNAMKNTPTTTTTTTTTTTQFGEVWLIRHGEKEETHISIDESSSTENNENILKAMYELSEKGWMRAHHLQGLVSSQQWPNFRSPLFATRPATHEEAALAFPNYARDQTGQSLVRREFQTLVPISEYLRIPINAEFAKGDIETASLEIAKAAVATVGPKNSDGADSRSPVLVSWDHCSLPTLVVKGFGCHGKGRGRDSRDNQDQEDDNECYRCWPDDRFGDVLKLNVSLTTRAITTTATTATGREAMKNETTTQNDFIVSSTILSMADEGSPSEHHYYYHFRHHHQHPRARTLTLAERNGLQLFTGHLLLNRKSD